MPPPSSRVGGQYRRQAGPAADIRRAGVERPVALPGQASERMTGRAGEVQRAGGEDRIVTLGQPPRRRAGLVHRVVGEHLVAAERHRRPRQIRSRVSLAGRPARCT